MHRSYLNILFVLTLASMWAVEWYIITLNLQQIPSPVVNPSEVKARPFKIAVVGAGVGGSSSAFWISKASERSSLNISVDIYDALPYVGGRVHSVKLSSPGPRSTEVVGLGAYTFEDSHHNMWRACKEFRIPVDDAPFYTHPFHVWSGEKLTRISESLWDVLWLLINYGLPYFSFGSVPALADQVAQQFCSVNKQHSKVWNTTTDFIQRLGFADAVTSRVSDYFIRTGMSRTVVRDLMPLSFIESPKENSRHALQALFHSNNYHSRSSYIKGGANRLFEEFVIRSNASLFLNTQVTSIDRLTDGDTHRWILKTLNGIKGYDAVILAAPFHLSNISTTNLISRQIPPVSYQDSYITVLTTQSQSANNSFLGFPSERQGIRHMISSGRGRKQSFAFHKLQYLERIDIDTWTVRINSPSPLSDEWLLRAFNGDIRSVYRHKWTVVEPQPTINFAPIQLDEGFYYLNGFESVVSSMETQIMASRNLVNILLREHFSMDICGPANQPTRSHNDPFVAGWDC